MDQKRRSFARPAFGKSGLRMKVAKIKLSGQNPDECSVVTLQAYTMGSRRLKNGSRQGDLNCQNNFFSF